MRAQTTPLRLKVLSLNDIFMRAFGVRTATATISIITLRGDKWYKQGVQRARAVLQYIPRCSAMSSIPDYYK